MINAVDKLHEQVCSALEGLDLPDEKELVGIVNSIAVTLRLTKKYTLTEDDIRAEIKRTQAQFVHRMGLGSWFENKKNLPWLKDRQGDITWYYWERYKKYLLFKRGFSNHVVNALDSITDDILDHMENPLKEGSWARKGLVVGDVQSGKTANYTGLICKATDAGYKVIIVLAGMLNSLRNQTQRRLDNDYLGWCTVKRVYVGSSVYCDEKKHPVCFTNSKQDFNKDTAQQIALQLGSLNEAIVFVVKKNKSSLTELYDWLVANNGYQLQKYPMLMIDDEADHASINTNKDDKDPTAINKAIRNLLSIFHKCSMVGYTATPFANIFIDPETEDEMINGENYRDLFPRDFIFSLDPPTNYIGPIQVFSSVESDNYVRSVDDNEDILPLVHKKDFEPACLTNSLKKAIRCFIVAKAIRILRGHQNQNHTMMINVSRFVRVQEYVKGLVLEYVKQLRQAINNHCSLPVDIAVKDTMIRGLHATWEEDYRNILDWADIQPLLKESIDPAEVLSINTSSSDVLSYDATDYPHGRTILVVGGLALSRGLTLEGLIVSYFLRNSIMYDTLMQMGRWFGYRDNYQDLCRVFLKEKAFSWYSYIAESTEELRNEIKEMSQMDMNPMEFGLKVRTHPDSLIVTARNKMRTGKSVPVKISLAGRLAETSVIDARENVIRCNYSTLENAVKYIKNQYSCEETKLGYYWQGVSSDIIIRTITNYQNHPLSMRSDPKPLVNYMKEMFFDTCDVLLRSIDKKSATKLNFADLDIMLPERTVADFNDEYIEFQKRRVASRGDESVGIPKDDLSRIHMKYPRKEVPDIEYRKYRMTNGLPPLFMIQIVRILDASGNEKAIVPCFGLGFPGDPGSSRKPGITVQYLVNPVWWKKHYQTETSEEE
jgi:hypothetical protein